MGEEAIDGRLHGISAYLSIAVVDTLRLCNPGTAELFLDNLDRTVACRGQDPDCDRDMVQHLREIASQLRSEYKKSAIFSPLDDDTSRFLYGDMSTNQSV